MQVTLIQAHPAPLPSMRRFAQALHRFLPLPNRLVTVSPHPPLLLRSRIPAPLRYTLYVLYTRLRLQQLAGRLPPCEVCHVVDHSESFLLPFLRASWKVVSCHDLIPLVEPRLYRHPYSRWWGQYLYRLTVRCLAQADQVLACSHATAQDVQSHLGVPSEKLKVVYPGVDADFFAPLPEAERERLREAMGFHTEDLVVLHVGSNAPYKNVETVWRVVAYLREGGHRVCWVKAGEPLSPRSRLELRQLGIAECVREKPQVGEERLLSLYQVSDVLLFPSWREGFGLPVLEALACGTPAVIADTLALREWAGEVCPSAPPEAVGALAEKVIQSAVQRGDPAFRQKLREFAQQFDWRRVGEHYARAYREGRGA